MPKGIGWTKRKGYTWNVWKKPPVRANKTPEIRLMSHNFCACSPDHPKLLSITPLRISMEPQKPLGWYERNMVETTTGQASEVPDRAGGRRAHSNDIDILRHALSGTAIRLSIRPGVVPGGVVFLGRHIFHTWSVWEGLRWSDLTAASGQWSHGVSGGSVRQRTMLEVNFSVSSAPSRTLTG